MWLIPSQLGSGASTHKHWAANLDLLSIPHTDGTALLMSNGNWSYRSKNIYLLCSDLRGSVAAIEDIQSGFS